jgi:hypothetical protein
MISEQSFLSIRRRADAICNTNFKTYNLRKYALGFTGPEMVTKAGFCEKGEEPQYFHNKTGTVRITQH